MTAVPHWLDRIGLAHCRLLLHQQGIDITRAADLTEDELCHLGLTPADSRALLRALASRALHATVLTPVPDTIPALTFGAPIERRQQLTVMFCDLVNFTTLASHRDPEDVRNLVRAFITTCSRGVQRYGGYVAQVLGDGVLAYFGWPSAHENDAERCVRSALAIVETLKSAGDSGARSVRIGIATSQVVVGGASGAGPGQVGLAVGEAPNLAARLQSHASPNDVLIADATRELLGQAFDLHDLGMVPLVGFGPCRVWRVDAVRRQERRSVTNRDAPLSALVGREQEVAQLLRDWEVARKGTGRLVVVGGEAGIGKSRLTEALRDSVRADGHAILRFQCSNLHQDVTLYPVITRLELAAGFAREDTPDQKLDKLERIMAAGPSHPPEAMPLLAALLSLPTTRYPPLQLSPQKQRELTLDLLREQIEALSRVQPVLMIVEDAHWIDPTSRELTDALISRLPSLRVLLVVTCRPEQPFAPKGIPPASVTVLTVTGLSDEQSADLARNVAKGKALPTAVIEWIIRRTDGLPLYIEELTKWVLESAQLLEEADRFTLLTPLPSLAVPRTLEGLLFERMDRREGMSTLARISAFIGRACSHELLAAVAAQKVAAFDEELESLIQTGLVTKRGTGPGATYTFRHALVRDAAYNSVPLEQQPALHQNIADVLDRQFPQVVASEPQVLAHHRTKAGSLEDLVAAIPLWRRAGEAALSRVALQEAVNYLETGLAIIERLEPSPERDRLELSLRGPLHTARLRWRGWASAEVGANAAAILWLAAQRQDDPQSLLLGLWGTWINTITQGHVAETPAWARRLLVEGRKRDDLDMRIFGERALLSSHFYLGELEEARQQQDRILELYEPRHATRWMELTGNDTKTAVGIFVSQALWMLGFPDQAVRLCEAKDTHARALGQPFDIGWAITWGSYVFDYRREPDRLLACAAEADRLGREQGVPMFFEVLAPTIEGLALLRKGQLPQARRALEQGIDGWKASGGHLNLPYVKAALAEALILEGNLDAGLPVLDECLEQIERPGWYERVWLPEVLRLKGWALLRHRRRAEAEAQLRASVEWARRQRARSWELRSATTLAQLLIEENRRDAARELLTPVCAWFSEGFDTYDLVVARELLEDLG
jgi:class 3 adenylate cyclase/tetratricopeptide (TPR) repeat protein